MKDKIKVCRSLRYKQRRPSGSSTGSTGTAPSPGWQTWRPRWSGSARCTLSRSPPWRNHSPTLSGRWIRWSAWEPKRKFWNIVIISISLLVRQWSGSKQTMIKLFHYHIPGDAKKLIEETLYLKNSLNSNIFLILPLQSTSSPSSPSPSPLSSFAWLCPSLSFSSSSPASNSLLIIAPWYLFIKCDSIIVPETRCQFILIILK